MKKILFLLPAWLFSSSLFAQKCLDISIVGMMGQIKIPGSAAQNFSECSTRQNEHKQISLADYGGNVSQLDTMLARTLREFNAASLVGFTGMSSQMSSIQTIDDAKKTAEQLKNMSPDQQKQWALQMQQSNQNGYNSGNLSQDDPSTTKLVMQAQDIAVRQLKEVNQELLNKLSDMDDSSRKESDAIKLPDETSCPQVGTVGLRSCACENEIFGRYYKRLIVIQDHFNARKAVLLQNYLPRIKELAGAIDKTVIKLKMGTDVKNPDLKRMLFSAQASAFSNSFNATIICIEKIRKESAELQSKKVNCENHVGYLSCG